MTTPNRKGRLPRELNSLMCVPFSSRPNSSHTTTRMPAAWQTGTRQFFKRLSSRDDILQQYGKSTGQLVPCMATGHGHRACHAGIMSAAAKGRNGASGHRRQGACRVVRRGAYDTSMSSSCAGLASSGAGTAAHQAVSLELLQSGGLTSSLAGQARHIRDVDSLSSLAEGRWECSPIDGQGEKSRGCLLSPDQDVPGKCAPQTTNMSAAGAHHRYWQRRRSS